MNKSTEHIVDTRGGIDKWEDRGTLVRCKDCVFRKSLPMDTYKRPISVCTYWYKEPPIELDDYCSHGRTR